MQTDSITYMKLPIHLMQTKRAKYVAKKAMNWAWLEGIPYATKRECVYTSEMRKTNKWIINTESGLGPY